MLIALLFDVYALILQRASVITMMEKSMSVSDWTLMRPRSACKRCQLTPTENSRRRPRSLETRPWPTP
jgi:hypothetical protein